MLIFKKQVNKKITNSFHTVDHRKCKADLIGMKSEPVRSSYNMS